MTVFILLLFIVALAYVTLIFWIKKYWSFPDYYTKPISPVTKQSYSIVVPFRNEEEYLGKCIDGLLQQLPNCPEFEIIAIDDHSTDNSKEIAIRKDITVLEADRHGKKMAITQAINKCKNEWIITVDADTTVEKEWLTTIDDHIQKSQSDVVVGPVKVQDDGTLLTRFQILDIAATMGITNAGISSNQFFLSNGANFIFKKEAFLTVGGYDGNEEIASGDDVFLLNKFIRNGSCKITYLKNVLGAVTTKAEIDFKALLNQRKRWATKTQAYANWKIVTLQGVVFTIALSILMSIFLFPIFLGIEAMVGGLLLLALKLVVDFFYLKQIVKFFNEGTALKSFIPASLMYLTYIILIGAFALWPSKVKWKGRSI